MRTTFNFVILAVTIAIVESCIQTVNPEEGIPATDFPFTTASVNPMATSPFEEPVTENLCDSCDISEILVPQTDPEKVVPDYTQPQAPVDGCVRTLTRCIDDRYVFCTSVTTYAVTPTGTFPVGDSEATGSLAIFTCDKAGDWYIDDVKEIQELYCIFLDCV